MTYEDITNIGEQVKGTGKGSVVKPLLQILGMYGIQVNGPGQIAGRFNGTIANKLFVFVDEAELTDSRATYRLKAIISEPTINLERKGKDPEPMPNYARFVLPATMSGLFGPVCASGVIWY